MYFKNQNIKISSIKTPSLHTWLKKLFFSNNNFWDSLPAALMHVKAGTCTRHVLPYLVMSTLSFVYMQILLASPVSSSGHCIATSSLWPPATISQIQPGYISCYAGAICLLPPSFVSKALGLQEILLIAQKCTPRNRGNQCPKGLIFDH